MYREHYILWYRLDGLNRYLIWYRVTPSDVDLDGVVLNSQGKIPVFANVEQLLTYAEDHHLAIEREEPILHNLDVVVGWCKNKRLKQPVDCGALLDAWNLFADVSRSLGAGFDSDKKQTQEIHSKIFYGNNLPSITPPGEHYVPLWSGRELRTIREIMQQGLTLFRRNVRRQ